MTASQTIRLETELLILGTGAAGCGAALAARQTGIRLLVIGRPEEQGGACYEEVLRRLKEESRWK